MRLKKKQRKVLELLDVPGFSVKQVTRYLELEKLKPEQRYHYWEVKGFLICVDYIIKRAEEEKKLSSEAAEQEEDYE